jgi:tRNA dimethylallyltransferase
MSFSHVADCWFLTGSTAAGKSTVGIELAGRLGGEIASIDSMAVYRGMDIGTAKPSARERAAMPHHLIDIVEPREDFSLAQYVAAAETCAADILSRGRTPIFVGGTPLYLKALLRGIFHGPPADWEFRERITADALRRGAAWLHEQVRTVDPVAARRLHPQDTKRLVRVLEVYEKTGKPISQLQQEFHVARPINQCRVFVLDWPRDVLYRRINARVEEMFAAGLVDEVRGLLGASSGPADPARTGEMPIEPLLSVSPGDGQNPLSRTARQALGYREVIEFLAGARSLAQTIELVQNRTRAFARRQLTWFRSLSECRPVACTGQDSAARLAEQIVRI